MTNNLIRLIQEYDAEAICNIYNFYVSHTHFTFEETILPGHVIKERIRQVAKYFPWFVCEMDGEVVGYAYADHWKTRSAYRFSAESTIYLKENYSGKGIGSELYSNLISNLKQAGFHSVISSIPLPNDGSIRFHQKFGYREVGVIKEVGYKFNRRIDVAILQLMI